MPASNPLPFGHVGQVLFGVAFHLLRSHGETAPNRLFLKISKRQSSMTYSAEQVTLPAVRVTVLISPVVTK